MIFARNRSSNPILKLDSFQGNTLANEGGTMTIQGTIQKSIILFLLVLAGAALSWQMVATNPGSLQIWAIGGSIAAFIMAMVTTFKRDWSPATAPAYAILKGAALGGISLMFEQLYGGIVFQAILLTLATMFGMLTAYTTGLIKVTEKLRSIIGIAVFAVAGVYLLSMLIGFFGMSIPFLFGSGPIGIGVSLLVIGIAAFTLLLDFDMIEQGARYNVPKYMEWYGSFGLMVSLVWIYIEILSLLARIQQRD